MGYLPVYDTACSLVRTIPRSRGRTSMSRAVPHSRYSYPRREDSAVSSVAYSLPRCNLRSRPIHTTSRRTTHAVCSSRSCRHHSVNTPSRCSTRSPLFTPAVYGGILSPKKDSISRDCWRRRRPVYSSVYQCLQPGWSRPSPTPGGGYNNTHIFRLCRRCAYG